MRIILFMPMLVLMVLVSFSALALEEADNGLSCDEVIDVVKNSDCAELVKPLIEGSYITAGFALRGLFVTITDNSSGNDLANIRGTTLPTPFVSFSLKPSYFDDSSFGWGVGVSYSDAYALEQRVIRSNNNIDVDLGSYITTTMLALTPNVFYQFGERYGDRYFRIGVGAAIGYAAVRGSVYLTDDESNNGCYQAGSDLVNQTGPATQKLRIDAIKNACQQQNYSHNSLGIGSNLFMQAQYNQWQVNLNAANLFLYKNNKKLEPTIISFEVAYVIPL